MRWQSLIAILVFGTAHAAVAIDPAFWETYEPYQQYAPATIRDLIALGEGDLLETARDIDGLELRVVGRESPASALVSARVVIDNVARERLQVKTVPFALSANAAREAVRPGSYQLIARSACNGLDPLVAAIRDFLLGIAGVSATGKDLP